MLYDSVLSCNNQQILLFQHAYEYPYMLMPDYMPRHPDDLEGRQAFAFGFGYIKALIQAVNSEV